MQMTIIAPSTGEVDDVIQRQVGSLAGTLVTTGDNRPIGIDHLVALVGSSPAGELKTEVIDENPDDSVCMLRITTEDEAWLTALQRVIEGLGNDPEKLREEVEKMDDTPVIEDTPDGKIERVSIKYDPDSTPVAGRFAKQTVKTKAKTAMKKIKADK